MNSPKDDCVIEMPWLKWNRDDLLSYMYDHKKYWSGSNGLFFRPKENHPIFQKLINQLKEFNVDITRSLYGKLEPGELLPPHVDPGREAGLYFPLLGNFNESPVIFNKDNKGTIDKKYAEYSHVYNCPTVINASKIHYVENNSNQERITFTLSFIGLSWKQVQILNSKK